jgi:hypothetical protein
MINFQLLSDTMWQIINTENSHQLTKVNFICWFESAVLEMKIWIDYSECFIIDRYCVDKKVLSFSDSRKFIVSKILEKVISFLLRLN